MTVYGKYVKTKAKNMVRMILVECLFLWEFRRFSEESPFFLGVWFARWCCFLWWTGKFNSGPLLMMLIGESTLQLKSEILFPDGWDLFAALDFDKTSLSVLGGVWLFLLGKIKPISVLLERTGFSFSSSLPSNDSSVDSFWAQGCGKGFSISLHKLLSFWSSKTENLTLHKHSSFPVLISWIFLIFRHPKQSWFLVRMLKSGLSLSEGEMLGSFDGVRYLLSLIKSLMFLLRQFVTLLESGLMTKTGMMKWVFLKSYSSGQLEHDLIGFTRSFSDFFLT